MTGTERASKFKPSITSHPWAGPLKLLKGHPEDPAPISRSSKDCGREAALDSRTVAKGWRADQ